MVFLSYFIFENLPFNTFLRRTISQRHYVMEISKSYDGIRSYNTIYAVLNTYKYFTEHTIKIKLFIDILRIKQIKDGQLILK